MQVRGALVTPVGRAPALQPVVFDVIDDLQRTRGEKSLRQEKQQPGQSEPDGEGDAQRHPQQTPAQQFVVDVPPAFAGFRQALRFELPRICGIAHECARQEVPQRLSEARARCVLGCGDMHVMAAQVFDLEPVVADAGQQQPTGAAFQRGVLVDQLVGHVDRQHAAHDALRQQPAGHPGRPETGLGEMPARPDQHAELGRQCGQGHPPEPAVAFQRCGLLRGRVLRIVAQRIVGQRQQHEQEKQRKPGHQVHMAAARAKPRGDRHQRGHHEHEQKTEAFPHRHAVSLRMPREVASPAAPVHAPACGPVAVCCGPLAMRSVDRIAVVRLPYTAS